MVRCIREFAAAQNKSTLVAAMTEKTILIVRICITTRRPGTFTLWSDPGGVDEAYVTPALYAGEDSVLDLTLGRGFGLPVTRGKSLGISSVLGGTPEAHGLILWYELVD